MVTCWEIPNMFSEASLSSVRLASFACCIALVSACCNGQSPRLAKAGDSRSAGSLEILQAFESELGDLIAQKEISVVAISRKPPAKKRQNPRVRIRGANDLFRDLRQLADNTPPVPSGAGVVISDSGLVLTQYLVIKPGDQHTITTVDGKSYPAVIKAADPRSGLAVLSVEGAELEPIAIGKAENLRKGSMVVTIGNPYSVMSDGQPTASFGTVTNLSRRAGDQVNLNNTPDERHGNYRTTLHHFGAMIQTDAKLGWNASGGALLNLAGELVGITTTVSTIAGHEQPAGYAIPLTEAFRRVVQTLSEGKEVEYGLLGISFSPNARATSSNGTPGMEVQMAYAGGPADQAGLTANDIIISIDEQPITSPDKLQLVVGKRPPATKVAVAYERSGLMRTAEVSLAKYYVSGEKVVTNSAPTWRGIRVDFPTAIPAQQLALAAQQRRIDPDGCVVVAEVDPESVSWQQGVRKGMFISHVGDTRVSSPAEFMAAVEDKSSSLKLRFTKPVAPAAAEAQRARAQRRILGRPQVRVGVPQIRPQQPVLPPVMRVPRGLQLVPDQNQPQLAPVPAVPDKP